MAPDNCHPPTLYSEPIRPVKLSIPDNITCNDFNTPCNNKCLLIFLNVYINLNLVVYNFWMLDRMLLWYVSFEFNIPQYWYQNSSTLINIYCYQGMLYAHRKNTETYHLHQIQAAPLVGLVFHWSFHYSILLRQVCF